jgi:hypothetical protein
LGDGCGNNEPLMQHRTLWLWPGVSLVVALLCGTVATGRGAEPADWQPLFNGKDLTGWVQMHEATFQVQDGCVRLVKGRGWLRTEKEYGDFVLELEFRPLEKQYDSGIFIRCTAEGKPWPENAWQVNLSYGALGGLVRGYKPVVPAPGERVPVNQWASLRLEVRGRTAKLQLNGEPAWAYDKLDTDRGYIGIQAEDKAFEFRNIRLLELK